MLAQTYPMTTLAVVNVDTKDEQPGRPHSDAPPSSRSNGRLEPDVELWTQTAPPCQAPLARQHTRAAHAMSGPPGVPGYLRVVVPTERRSSQARTTRLAMPSSAALPQARGS